MSTEIAACALAGDAAGNRGTSVPTILSVLPYDVGLRLFCRDSRGFLNGIEVVSRLIVGEDACDPCSSQT